MNSQDTQSTSPLTTPQPEYVQAGSQQQVVGAVSEPQQPVQANVPQPTVDFNPAPQTTFTSEEPVVSRASSSHGTVIGLVVTLLVLLGGGVAGAAWFGVLPFFGVHPEPPEVVLYNALEKSLHASSVAFEGEIISTVRELNTTSGSALGGAAEIALTYAGAYQGGALTQSGMVSVETAMAVEGIQLSAEIEVRWIGSDLYMRLGRVGTASNPTASGSDPTGAMAVALVAGMAQMLQGQWIYIPLDEILENLESELPTSADMPDPADYLEDIDAETLMVFMRDQYEDFIALFAIEELPANVDEERRFALLLDMSELTGFMIERFVPFVETNVGVEPARTLREELEEVRQEYIAYPPFPYEIAIGRDGYVSEVSIPSFTHSDDEHLIKIRSVTRFFGYNEPVQVSVPEDVMTLEELMMSIFGPMFMNEQVPIEEFSLDTFFELIPGSSLLARVPITLPQEWYAAVPESIDMRANAFEAFCAVVPATPWCR